jgi:hypothetical protein
MARFSLIQRFLRLRCFALTVILSMVEEEIKRNIKGKDDEGEKK